MLRPGGRTACFTIYAPRGLPLEVQRRARAAAPTYGWSRADHADLMRSAGFVDVEEIDRTSDYLATLRAWHDRSQARADDLAALIGADAFEERQAERRAAIDAVEDGIQRRVLIVGVKRGVRP